MTWFPVIPDRDKVQDEYAVDEDNGGYAGTLRWYEAWGCYVFDTDMECFFGPAFLAALVGEMIRLEARRRRSS